MHIFVDLGEYNTEAQWREGSRESKPAGSSRYLVLILAWGVFTLDREIVEMEISEPEFLSSLY